MDDMLAYAEVDEILNLVDDVDREKIPEKVRNFFKEERMSEYKPKIDINRPLIEQNLKRKTIILLAILKFRYWCNSEEEKQQFLSELAKNEDEKIKLEEKYSKNNFFPREVTTDKPIKEYDLVPIIQYKKPSFFQKVLIKIKSIFKHDKWGSY